MIMCARQVITPEFIDLEHADVLRQLLQCLLEHGDVAGVDRRGRPVLRIEIACEPWLLDALAAIGASCADLEEDDPAEEGE